MKNITEQEFRTLTYTLRKVIKEKERALKNEKPDGFTHIEEEEVADLKSVLRKMWA